MPAGMVEKFQSLEKSLEKVPIIGTFLRKTSSHWNFLPAAALLLPLAVCADTRHVDVAGTNPVSPFASWETAATNIQDAVNACLAGDTVLVTDGFYSVAAQIAVTQQLSISSVNGPDSTVIHAESNRCLYASSPAMIEGFTFTNGFAGSAPYHGAGVYANATGATVRNCRFESNSSRSRGQGGGLWVGISGIVENCSFRGNRAGDGGGLFARDGARVSDCYFEENVSATNGGGAHAYFTGPAFSNCVFIGNAAVTYGGGLYTRGAVAGCRFEGNAAGYYGGGIGSLSSGLTVDRCEFIGNVSSNDGGGVYTSLAEIRNSLFIGNAAADEGGGARLGTSLMENCTVVSNTAPKGGGYYSSFSTSLNSIVYFNDPLNYSNRNASSVCAYTCISPDPGGTGNITNDPCFLLAPAGNWRLATNSPCRESGTNQSWMGAALDLDGALRVAGDSVDMGAYELGALTADFIAIPTTGVAPLDAVFSGAAAGTNAGSLWFRWDFTNDGSFDAEGRCVTNRYPGGVYTVRLAVSNDAGEATVMIKTNFITAMAGVAADFTAAPRTGAAPFVVQFTDLSANVPQFWSWDFDNDGVADSKEQNPQWTFNSTGLFTVALTVSNDFGGANGSADTMVKTSYVSVPVYHLVADFTVSKTNALTYETLQFTDLSQNGPAYWAWYFRNVGGGDSFEQNPTSYYYTAAGYKTVKLIVSNEWSTATAVKTNFMMITGPTPVHYVAPGGGNQPPYTNWETAAHSLEAAIDAAETFDTVVVSNGVYGVPFLGLNFIGMTLVSVNGASNTIITGGGTENIMKASSVRQEPTRIDGFTLTNGYTTGDGAGIWITENVTLQNCIIAGCRADDKAGGVLLSWGGVVSNCDIVGNTAGSGGGGVYLQNGGTVTHCRVAGNVSGDGGGGVHLYSTNDRNASLISHCIISGNSGCGAYIYRGVIRNCLLVTNRAAFGGGLNLSYADAENCTVYGNDAANGGGIYMASVSTARNCIVWGNTRSNLFRNAAVVFEYGLVEPATAGAGNLSAAPAFMDADGFDFRLKYGSPGLDAGTDAAQISDDLFGTVRPLDGNYDGASAVDMGACEYNPATADSNGDGVPDWWYHGYGLNPASATVGAEHADGDGFPNADEYIADTNPTNGASLLRITAISNLPPVTICFDSSSNRVYSLACSSNLAETAWSEVPGAEERRGVGGSDFMQDTNAVPGGAYRLSVHLP